MKTNWQTYDWRVQGKASQTQVDVDWNDSPGQWARLPYLLVAYIQPRKRYGDDFLSAADRGRMQKTVKKVQKLCGKLNAALCAIQTYGNTLALHIYCTGEGPAGKIEALIEKMRWAIAEYESRPDPGWSRYLGQLYPNSAQKQTMVNKDMIELMQKYGDNPHLPRPVNHYVSFHDEVSRTGFQNEAKAAGYALHESVYFAEAPLAHSSCVRCISTIEKRALDEHTSRIVMLAEKYGGRYDGWDCKSMGNRRRPVSRLDGIKIYKAGQ